MNELPAAGVVRVIGPEDAGAGFIVSAGGLIVTCAHVLAGAAPGTVVSVEPHGERRPLAATVALSRDPPDVAILQLTAPVPPQAAVLPLGRSPATPQAGLRTFGYPQVRPEAGLPGELAVLGVTSDAGYDQLALRSEEATLGFSGAPIWDPELGVVVGMVKSIARADPGQRLGAAAIGVPAEVIRGLCPELRLPTGCPYRGLEPFTEEHAGYYYGREHATSQLLASLAARDFVTVVAVSGGGKSSLLQAGLAKGLRDRPAAGLAQRVRCYQRVGNRPHAELLHSLALHGMALPREVAAAPPQEVAAAVLGAVPPAGLIIVADQFERLYTDCTDAERKRFVDLLLRLATDAVKVVIGLRADFYHLALADLGERLAAGQVALPPMSDQDLSQAIAAPAAKLLRSFQPGLAQRIAADVHGRPGDLPLLQFALTRLWERDAEGGVLTERTYRGLGVELPDGTHLPGAQGALIRRAEQLWQDLSPADRPRLQRILLGLIAAQPAGTGAGLAGSPRDLSRPALLAQWDDDDQRLIQQLVGARLLTADRAAAGGQATVEVSHEALLRAWPRLRRWLEERGKFVQWRAQDLAPNLERWLNSRKAPGAKGNPEFLLPRTLLDLALRWLGRYPDELAGPPAAYIRASSRRRTLRRGLAGGSAAVLVAASLVSAGIFFSLRQDAVQQQDIADSRLLIDESQSQGDTDPVISKLLSVAAWRIHPFSDAWHAMLAAAANPEIGAITVGRGGVASSEAFSPDGKTLVIGGSDGTVQVWDVATERQASRTFTVPGIGLLDSVALGPDGEILASSEGAGKTVQVWDVATGRQDGRTIRVPGGQAPSTLSPDGTTLATISGDGTVRVWDVATGRQDGRAFTFPDGGPGSVALGPGGRILATISGDGTVRVWDVATGRQADGIAAPPGEVAPSLVALSPDGKTLATGGDDGTVRLFDLVTGEQIGNNRTAPGGGAVYSLALGPGGKTLASASSDDLGTAQLWDVTTGQRTGSFTVPGGEVGALALSPDGTTTALVSTDNGTALVRDVVATGRQVGRSFTAPSGGAAAALALDPGGTALATGGSHGTVQVRDVATGRRTGSFTVPGGAVESLALSPGGTTLATVGRDRGTVRVWDAATGRQTRSFTVSGYGAASTLAFSPDGKALVAASGDGTARVWDVATGQQVGSILFLPEDADGITPSSVALSPGGTTLATASENNTVQLWDVATGQQVGSLTVPYYGADSLAFSPDGKTVITGNDGDTVQVWDVAYLTDPVSDLCALAGRSLTRAEWALYAPGLAYRNICP